MSDEHIAEEKNKARPQPNNPLHGVTLEMMLTALRDRFSWKELNQKVELNCFFSHPSIKSSLTFLRKNAWARKKVENLYLQLIATPETPESMITPEKK
ncbi:MAG TPA: VF530 family protein [Candidatus Rifleibacterium sp.]|nr:VF530 family protein [Candidatus Rifleibacterium sp.]HPT46665.1 VF530 family protein [Candidatus Rifleibacterium sp.]